MQVNRKVWCLLNQSPHGCISLLFIRVFSVHQGPCTLHCSLRCVPIWIQEAKILNPEVSLRTGICQDHLMSLDLVSQRVSSVQFSHSVVSDSLRPHEPQHVRPPCPSPTPGIHPNPYPLYRWCHPTISSSVVPFSSCPQSFPASDLSSELALRIRWPNYWNFSFRSSPTNEYSGLISFRNDWFDLPAVQGTFKSLSQHHNSKASILRCSALFMVQLSHPYMITRKTIALIIQNFVTKVMSLLFSMLNLS